MEVIGQEGLRRRYELAVPQITSAELLESMKIEDPSSSSPRRASFTGGNIFCRVKTYIQEADPWEWLQSLPRIAALDVPVIVPGHGELCGTAYCKAQADPYPIGQHRSRTWTR